MKLKYCEFIALFLISKKLIVSAGEAFRDSNQFLSFLENSENAYEQFVNWWIGSGEWNEEFVEGNVAHTDLPPGNLINIPEFRRIVVRHIAELPSDRWCNFDGFAEALNPQIEATIPRRGATASPERNTRGNELIVESMVAETLYWLGLTSVGLQDPRDLVKRSLVHGRLREQDGLPGDINVVDLVDGGNECFSVFSVSPW